MVFVFCIKANKMHWIVDEVPNEALLNTSGWRYIIPELYKAYPNHSMNLNISVSLPPTINVDKQQITTTIPLDVVIDVLDEEETIPVACISMVRLVKLCFYFLKRFYRFLPGILTVSG